MSAIRDQGIGWAEYRLDKRFEQVDADSAPFASDRSFIRTVTEKRASSGATLKNG